MNKYQQTFTALDWRGNVQTITCNGTPVAEYEGVALLRQGANLFAVVYGLQKKEGLDYDTAAREFGENVFHALACSGALYIGA